MTQRSEASTPVPPTASARSHLIHKDGFTKTLWFVYLFITHETRQDLAEHSWKKAFLYIHVFCFIHVALSVFFFYLVPNMQAIHPIFCILYGVSFIVFVLDWVNYIFYRKYYVFVRWTILFFALMFGGMLACAIWAITQRQSVNYLSMLVSIVLLFLSIKWLRFPNVDTQTLLNTEGSPLDKSMLEQAVLAQPEADNLGFLSVDATNKSLKAKGLTNPVARWLGKPIRLLLDR